MLKIRRNPDLGQEAFDAEYGAELGVEELEGDVAVVPDVAREVDRRHSAGADLALYLIAFGKRFPELRYCVQGSSVPRLYRSARDKASSCPTTDSTILGT